MRAASPLQKTHAMEIGEPTLLTKLPRAGLSEEGSRWFSQVHGVKDGKSRKRHELCAAIDGNALSILEVVNGKTLVSWPIPPDSSFTSAPYSERIYVDSKSFSRKSWCPVKRRDTIAIQYFEQAKIGTVSTFRTTSHVLKESQSSIIRIEAVGTTERVVITAQEDGTVTVFPLDGGEALYTYKFSENSSPIKLMAAQFMSLLDAQISVLKGRPDISSTLSNEHIVIAAAYNSATASSVSDEIRLGLWALPLGRGIPSSSASMSLVHYSLHSSSDSGPSSKVAAYFKAAGSKLELSLQSTTITFDLTFSFPLKSKEHKLLATDEIANIDLSNDIKLFYAPGRFELYNSKYNSLLAKTHLSGTGHKRKRDHTSHTRMHFIAYFSHLRRVVAHSGSQLLAVDIHSDNADQKSFKQASLLVGNLLRGKVEQSSSTRSKSNKNSDQEWLNEQKELNQLAERRDSVAFQHRLKTNLGLHSWENLKDLSADDIDFILSRMFNIKDSVLELVLYPQELFEWCAKCGYLNEHRIAGALQTTVATFGKDMLPRCLLESLQGFSAVQKYIQHAPHIELATLATIVKAAINQAIESNEGDHTVRPSLDLENGTVGNHPDIPPSSDASRQTSLRSRCLVYALQRLAFVGITTVSNQLRASLQKPEVLALVQFLRQQLFLGGYTRSTDNRSYPTPPESNAGGESNGPQESAPQLTLESIVILLNGCVDCLGVVGILGTDEDQIFIERMVSELRSEIENATVSVTDSTYLQGLLRETLRYTESVERQPFEVRRKVERPYDTQGEKGRIVTIFSEGDLGDNGAQLSTALPLSLKAEEDIDLRKMQKGGRLKSRSVREMGMMKDRLKAPYSFERLVL